MNAAVNVTSEEVPARTTAVCEGVVLAALYPESAPVVGPEALVGAVRLVEFWTDYPTIGKTDPPTATLLLAVAGM